MPTFTEPVAPTFRTALVSLLQARPVLSGVKVEAVWPGPDAEEEGIYLSVDDRGPRGSFTPSAIKAGRLPLDEDTEVPFTCVKWRAADTPYDDPVPGLFVLFNELVSTLMDNKTVSDSVNWNRAITYEVTIPPFENGRAAHLVGAINLAARIS